MKKRIIALAKVEHKYSKIAGERTYNETVVSFKTVDDLAMFLGYLALDGWELSKIRINQDAKSFYLKVDFNNMSNIQTILVEMIENPDKF